MFWDTPTRRRPIFCSRGTDSASTTVGMVCLPRLAGAGMMAFTMTTRRDLTQVALLEELYARVPPLECVGKCGHSCVSGIDMSEAERRRISEAGCNIPERHDSQPGSGCPALTFLGTCSVYWIRPMVCRIWGAAESMPCPHGCGPADGRALLSAGEALELLVTSLEVGGSSLDDQIAQLRPYLHDPEIIGLLTAMVGGDPTAPAKLITAVRRHRGRDSS